MISRLAILGASLALLTAPGPADQADAQPDAAVAIATFVHGAVETRRAPGAAEPLRRFDRLHSGAAIETAPDAAVILAFRSGVRTRIDGSSRVRVETSGVTRLAGSTTALAQVPVVPIVAPVASGGSVIAAVRIRAGGLVVRTPDRGMTTSADATELAFDPAAADSFDIEIEDAAARIAWRGRGPGSPVHVPAGILEPGRAYRWRVRAQTPAGFVLEGQGAFVTLAAAASRARAELRAAVVTDDPSWPGLLAEVDFSLGLWTEALDAFRRIRDHGTADAVVLARIAELERRLAAVPHPPDR